MQAGYALAALRTVGGRAINQNDDQDWPDARRDEWAVDMNRASTAAMAMAMAGAGKAAVCQGFSRFQSLRTA